MKKPVETLLTIKERKKNDELRVVITIAIVGVMLFITITYCPAICLAASRTKIKQNSKKFIETTIAEVDKGFKPLYTTRDFRDRKIVKKTIKTLKTVKARKVWSKGFYRPLNYKPYIGEVVSGTIESNPSMEESIKLLFIQFMVLCQKLRETNLKKDVFLKVLLCFQQKGIKKQLLSKIFLIRGGESTSLFTIFFLKMKNFLQYIKEHRGELYKELKLFFYRNRQVFITVITMIVLHFPLYFKYYSLLEKLYRKIKQYNHLNTKYIAKKKDSEEGTKVFQMLIQQASGVSNALMIEKRNLEDELKTIYRVAGICASFWEKQERNFRIIEEASKYLYEFFSTLGDKEVTKTISTLMQSEEIGPSINTIIDELDSMRELINSHSVNVQELSKLRKIFEKKFGSFS